MSLLAQVADGFLPQELIELGQQLSGSWFYTIIVLMMVIPLVLMYIGGPVLVYCTLRMNRNPIVNLLRASKSSSKLEEAREYFEEYDLELEDNGFEMVSEFYLPNVVPTSRMYGQLWLHEPSKTAAALTMSFTVQNGVHNYMSKQFEFSSEFQDGMMIDTSNHKDFGMYPSTTEKQKRSMFWELDIDKVWKAHQEFSNEYASHSPRVEKLNEIYQGDVVEYLRQGMLNEYKTPVEKGYLTNGSNNMLRPTIKGAIIMTYKLLTPIKQFRQFLMKRKVMNKLNELGVDLGA